MCADLLQCTAACHEWDIGVRECFMDYLSDVQNVSQNPAVFAAKGHSVIGKARDVVCCIKNVWTTFSQHPRPTNAKICRIKLVALRFL